MDLPSEDIVRNIRTLRARPAFSEYELKYYTHLIEVLSEILRSREHPNYIIPVPGSRVPTHPSFIPNASRSYRKNYTDGIHHGWDFYGSFGSPVVALDDGVIIHVRRGFLWEDFSEIRHDLHGLDG